MSDSGPADRPHLRPAVFLDRDNTLIVGADYLGDPREVELMPGAAECVAGVRRMGFATVAVSNQSGVARGYFTENDVRAVNAQIDRLLQDEDDEAVIDRHDFCPHHPTHGVAPYRQACQCRKPKDGMLRRSATTLGLDLTRSWVIGDAPRDIESGRAAGCRTILLDAEGITPSPAARAASNVPPDFRVRSLLEALAIIQRESGFEPAPRVTLATGSAALDAEEEYRDTLTVETTLSQTEGDDRRDIPPAGLGADELAEDNDRDDMEDDDEPEQSDGRSAHERVLERLISQTESEPEVEVLRPSATSDLRPTPFAERPDQPPPHLDQPDAHFSSAAPVAGQTADRIAATTAQILDDLRRQRETPRDDFNLFRLLAGVMQVLALAAIVWGIMLEFDNPRLVLGVFLQLLTMTLLFASRPSA